jgi:hypothetical protein
MSEKYKQVIGYLIRNKISDEAALAILDKTIKIDWKKHASNPRIQWKMWRFTLYLWARIDEDKKGLMGKKIETIRRVVAQPKYQRLWDTFPQRGAFNLNKEIKNLNLLVTDPRQFGYFREENFVFEGTQRKIPQEIIDKVR